MKKLYRIVFVHMEDGHIFRPFKSLLPAKLAMRGIARWGAFAAMSGFKIKLETEWP